ncbi:MAG: phosphoglycerate dehydrogenase [Desulfobacterales bacterium]|jgi:phosphoglycerate dehydrogenase-like enzyme
MKKILVTPRSLTKDGDPALDLLTGEGFEIVFSTPGTLPLEGELIQLLPGCVGYLAGVESITAAVLESAVDLKVISRNGTGINTIDLEAAQRLNIEVLRAEGANARGVAELTLGVILSLIRSIPFSDAGMKREKWERRKGLELQGRSLGLIGCGQIGQLVCRLALAFGMEVIAYDAFPDPKFSPGAGFRFADLNAVLAKSEIISLHCPEQPDGRPILDRGSLDRLKPGVFIVNTARASLIDEAAILESLDDGRVAGLALDVYDREPPDASLLLSDDRVIATPHIGGYTAESVSRATRAAVENLLKFFKGN